ncbi:MAG: DASS family sodium-coupled anion symporter [Balneola sp.]|nr:MAG: DASS family sodium-coupled anion symporter [Balneola sp.]
MGLILSFFIQIEGLSFAGHVALGIFFLAAVFWLFEPVPIYATSVFVILLQVLLLSKEGFIFQEADIHYIPDSYTSFIGTLGSPIIILFLGGFVLADAAVKYDLDRNLTRILLGPFGQKPGSILLGLMVITALLSAFMSNTATTAMMMTVIIPIIARVGKTDPLRIGLALSIPFAANIGGIATPIGTPPNAVVIGALSQQGISIPFGEWMILASPLVVVALIFTWVLLLKMFKPEASSIQIDMTGTFNTSKKAIMLYVAFGLTVIFWITESFHGVKSAIVALVPIVFLSLTGVISKEDIRKLPWEVLWLVAGGISLGISMKSTGLAEWIVGMVQWGSLGSIVLLLVFSIVAVLMSNFLSNTVTATLLIPLAISLATSGLAGERFNLIIVSLVIGVSCSMAMMLPISTPPNAIAMSTGIIETKSMTKTGISIGIFGVLLVLLYALFYWPLIIN